MTEFVVFKDKVAIPVVKDNLDQLFEEMLLKGYLPMDDGYLELIEEDVRIGSKRFILFKNDVMVMYNIL